MQSWCRPQLFSACRVTVLAGRKHGQRNLCGVGALVVCQNSFLVSRASQSDPAAGSYQEHRLRAERSGGRAPHSEQRHNMQSKNARQQPVVGATLRAGRLRGHDRHDQRLWQRTPIVRALHASPPITTLLHVILDSKYAHTLL